MGLIASDAAAYRVQLHAGFTFDDTGDVVGYLAALGITHLYCSPYLQAAPGSTHGYDVVDHGRLNDELGGAAAHDRLVGRLKTAGLGQLLDIVPNHMALAGRANAWWWDVLENGPSSPYATHFDIDWDPPQRKLIATVLMPILGDHYGRVLEAGDLRVEHRLGSFTVQYFEHEAPLSPRTLDDLLRRAAARAGSEELEQLAVGLGDLPPALLTEPAAIEERHVRKVALLGRVEELCRDRPDVAAAVDAEVAAVNRDPDLLDALLQRQNYRLAYWRTASEELSYRRFFNIETLAGLRVEDEQVFFDTHRLVLEMVAAGAVDGLRVDHVDGLADPEGYLARLGRATAGSYVVVEKILEVDEDLPESWPVAGTTGYDFLNRVNRLFVDAGNKAALEAAYVHFTGEVADYGDVVRQAKLEIMRNELDAEVERLSALLADVCEDHRRYRDFTRRELRAALSEMIAAFPVYRSYAYPGRPVTDSDRQHVAAARDAAGLRRVDLDSELLDFIADLVTTEYPGVLEADFAVRFAQLSAPVMAKGVEDTAFYRYYPLSSLNEVGGNPAALGRPVEDFHLAMRRAGQRWPASLLTLSTHDTKRSGDVRARIDVLSELPEAWERAVTLWAGHNEHHKRDGWPDRNTEYLLYQTLVGAWPVPTDRAAAYMEKAAREAKIHTSWVDPAGEYDLALREFVAAVLADDGFVAGLTAFLGEHQIIERGRINSLAQTALLLTCPGIPDIYQGTEVWDLSLVDPDNRRPVDYDSRRGLLEVLASAEPEVALGLAEQGGPKLWLIHRLLRHRRRAPASYGMASGYEPLPLAGPYTSHAVAFARSGGLAVVVPRLPGSLSVGWAGTTVTLPAGTWINVLTDDKVNGGDNRVDDLFHRFPVAVLGRPG